MDKIKRESEAAILKYIIKRYKLPVNFTIEEEDSEDVRFNYEFTLSNLRKPNGLLAHDPLSQYEDGNAKNVDVENEMAVACTLKIMSYDYLISTKRIFQCGMLVLPHHYATLLRGKIPRPLQTMLDVFVLIRALLKPDDSTMFALFVAKHRGLTFFTKLAIEKVAYKERTFLTPLWDVAVKWLKGTLEQDQKQKS